MGTAFVPNSFFDIISSDRAHDDWRIIILRTATKESVELSRTGRRAATGVRMRDVPFAVERAGEKEIENALTDEAQLESATRQRDGSAHIAISDRS